MNAKIITELDDLSLPDEAYSLRQDLPPGTPFNLINVQVERLEMILNVVYDEYVRGERTYSDVGLANLVGTAQSMLEVVKDLLQHGEKTSGNTAVETLS